MADGRQEHTRRAFLGATLGVPVAVVGGGIGSARARDRRLAPTPACGDGAAPTASQTAGPFFTPGSPRRASLLDPGLHGTPLVVTGLVVSTDCRALAGALLDFWQADGQGRYDNAGYRLRGHQFSDGAGRYRLETVVPGGYPGRTRHIHVKVQAPGGPVLVTQLYFPDEPNNRRDHIFDPALLLRMEDAAGGRIGTFDFVLPVSPSRS